MNRQAKDAQDIFPWMLYPYAMNEINVCDSIIWHLLLGYFKIAVPVVDLSPEARWLFLSKP